MMLLFLNVLLVLLLRSESAVFPVALGNGSSTLAANDALSWKLPTPGLLSFDIRVTSSSGWGSNVFDAAAYIDVLLVNRTKYDIYSSSSGTFTVEHGFVFKRVNMITRRDLYLTAAYNFEGEWYLVIDNGYTWDLDAAGVDPGPSARPPRGRPTSLSVEHSVSYVISSTATQLTAPCGLVTLNKSPNAVFFYRFAVGSWELEFGIDSCSTGIIPTGDVTSGPCPLVYYILDRTNFIIIANNNNLTPAHDVAIQPPPSGARFALNVSATVGELYFVLYAKSSPLSAWYRVDKLREMCGRALAVNNTCIAGTADCACGAQQTCNRGLHCQNNVCIACAVGDTGCSCSQAYTCGTADLRCIGASLRVPGVCTRCDLGTLNCAPRPNATVFWERCDPNLRPLIYGNAEVCLQCTRGDVSCRCGFAGVCSESTNSCNATIDVCFTDPSRMASTATQTTTVTPKPTATTITSNSTVASATTVVAASTTAEFNSLTGFATASFSSPQSTTSDFVKDARSLEASNFANTNQPDASDRQGSIATPSIDIAFVGGIAGGVGALCVVVIVGVTVVVVTRRRRIKSNRSHVPVQQQSMAEFVSARESASLANRSDTAQSRGHYDAFSMPTNQYAATTSGISGGNTPYGVLNATEV